MPSSSIINTKWINLAFFMFSPRQMFGMIIGMGGIFGVVLYGSHPITMVIAVGIMIFSFIPFTFLTPEKQILSYLKYHGIMKGSSVKSKNISGNIGFGGKGFVDSVVRKEKVVVKKIESIKIQNIEEPHTMTIKTSAAGMTPVNLYFDDENGNKMLVISTITDNSGKLSGTVMLERFGQHRVRVIDDSDNVVYDNIVEFERK